MRLEHRTLKFILAPIIALLAIVPVSAQFSGNVDVSFKAITDTVTIGDPITMTLRVTAPSEKTAVIPKLDTDWGDFEIRQQLPPTVTENDDGTKTTEQTIVATLFDVGTFSTPNWDISIADMMGNTTRRAVPKVSITVKSVLKDGDTELRDLKPQAELPVPFPWLWMAGIAIALALAYLVWKYLRPWLAHRRTATPDTPVEVDDRPPHEIALAELARIDALDLPGQGRFKEHYTLVGDCLRQYLEGRYDVAALEHTTAEIKTSLKRTGIERATARDVISLLEQCDWVKFARFVPTLTAARDLIPAVRTIITATAETAIEPVAEGEKVSM